MNPKSWKKWYGGIIRRVNPGWGVGAYIEWEMGGNPSKITEFIPQERLTFISEDYGIEYSFILSETSKETIVTYKESIIDAQLMESSPYTQEMRIEATLKNLKYQSEFDSRCFIATAVYESSEAPEVIELRKYRDNVLMENLAGHLFVKVYYAVSPSISEILEKNRHLKRVGRVFLDRIVKRIK